MKKLFKHYVIIWLLVLCLFNIILFVAPLTAEAKGSSIFWLGYSLSSSVLVLQFLFSLFRSNTPRKIFFDFQLENFYLMLTAVIFLTGVVFIIFYTIPLWVGIIICAIITMSALILIIKVHGEISTISNIEENIENSTQFIRTLTADAQKLLTQNNAPELKKIYEAVRFSDPVSRDELKNIESDILIKFEEISNAVTHNDESEIKSKIHDFLNLISERNEKCKTLKGR